MKDTTVDRTVEAIDIARELRYGVTGNFVVDPDWNEADFERLWSFIEEHELGRAGFTILTPLPGTAFFDEARPRLRAVRWSQYDMHHLLWEPRLGAARFFELYCETWRRSILNLSGRKSWRDWARQVMLLRTQRAMRPDAYLGEHLLAEPDPRTFPLARREALTGRAPTARRVPLSKPATPAGAWRPRL